MDGRARQFDIRNWDENHENMSKGITLTKDELTNLKELLNKINIDEAYNNDSVYEISGIDGIFDDK